MRYACGTGDEEVHMECRWKGGIVTVVALGWKGNVGGRWSVAVSVRLCRHERHRYIAHFIHPSPDTPTGASAPGAAGPRPWVWLLLAMVVVLLVLGVLLWPSLAGQVAYGCQPGAAVLLPLPVLHVLANTLRAQGINEKLVTNSPPKLGRLRAFSGSQETEKQGRQRVLASVPHN